MFLGFLVYFKFHDDAASVGFVRLTLVSGWNMEEIQGYKELIELGTPDFIEIKGVTYCGSSGASDLTMKNVPYHKDVCEFGEELCRQTEGIFGSFSEEIVLKTRILCIIVSVRMES